MSERNDERQVLMNRIRVCDFVLVETAEFFDTHPDNADALAYHQKYSQLAKEAKTEYVRKFGPLEHRDFSGGNHWNWVDGPWPWEKEAQ